MPIIQCHEWSAPARKWFLVALVFFLIWLPAYAAAPAWLSQIKLSAINGYPDHPLAVINGKTVSSGEACTLKLKNQTVQIQCLDIHEQSVSVQVQGVSGVCELAFSGIQLPVENSPAVALPTSTPATVVQPAHAPVSPIRLFVPTLPTNPPSGGKSFSIGIGWVLTGLVVALLVGVALGSGGMVAQQWVHRKNTGEALVADVIDVYFKRPHLLVNNITLPTAEGTTQIDHVLVADTGIFVIETKHYSGWIFGDPKDSQWTQTIYRHKSRFQNPLRQNYAHVVALQNLFDLPENHFHSVVVFTGDAKFKSDLGGNVVKVSDLVQFLAAERPVVFDERKMAYIVGRIEMKRERRSLETDEYHINHLRHQHQLNRERNAQQSASR